MLKVSLYSEKQREQTLIMRSRKGKGKREKEELPREPSCQGSFLAELREAWKVAGGDHEKLKRRRD